jgi:hypothetical protein
MAVRVVVERDEVDRELKRLEFEVPDYKGVAGLEAVLDVVFEETQASVHVVTGSLRASGRTSSDVREHVWSGDITYGGPSPGYPHDPVRYAVYEQRRGGAHDFLRNTHAMDDLFLAAVVEALRGS